MDAPRQPCSEDQQNRLDAAVELIGRTGATNLNFGYLHDDVPTYDAAWYATASYRGTRIICENKSHPIEAIEGLAIRLLTGAQCQKCKRLITLNPLGAYAHDSRLLNGTEWSAEDQAAAGVCLWVREGRHWIGCDDKYSDNDSIDEMLREIREYVSTANGGNTTNRGRKTSTMRNSSRRLKRKKKKK